MFNQKKHREILFNILRKIYSSSIGKDLGFKGGTMLYFFYELDRFSVDLDFDLLNQEKEQEIFDELGKLLKDFGEIKDQFIKKKTIFFLLSYEDGQANVKIEISRTGGKVNEYEIKNFYGIDVKTQVIEDSFANKLVTSLDRRKTANRDFYDIEFMFRKGFAFNDNIIENRTGKKSKDFLVGMVEFLNNYKPVRGWIEGLGELVDEEKKKMIKNNLKKDLIGQIEFCLDSNKKWNK